MEIIPLGDYEFHDDELEIAGAFEFLNSDPFLLDDVFTFHLDEIIAAMWTFDQGLLSTDIANSRMTKFPLEKVWHARHLVSKVNEELRADFCQAIHMLSRLKTKR